MAGCGDISSRSTSGQSINCIQSSLHLDGVFYQGELLSKVVNQLFPVILDLVWQSFCKAASCVLCKLVYSREEIMRIGLCFLTLNPAWYCSRRMVCGE